MSQIWSIFKQMFENRSIFKQMFENTINFQTYFEKNTPGATSGGAPRARRQVDASPTDEQVDADIELLKRGGATYVRGVVTCVPF